MNKSNKETNLIKKLLADQLDKKERKKMRLEIRYGTRSRTNA